MFKLDELNNLLNNNNNDNMCDICYELNDEYFSIKLDCSHIFHYECLKQSFKYCENNCPYCNIPILLSKFEYIKPKCKAILKKGKNKGKNCSNNAIKNNNCFCKLHKIN